MRRTILLSLLALFAVVSVNEACAQRRGGGGAGFARGGYRFSPARTFSPSRFGYGHERARFGYAAYGSGYGAAYGVGYASLPYDSDYVYPSYDSGAAYPYPPQPVVFVQPPPSPVVEPPGHPVITEYNWPAPSKASSPSASSTTPESEPQTFAIVLKDGSNLSAMSIFASDDGLHYVDPDERHLRISMSKVDRAATLKLNRARNLNLYLPAAD